MSKPQAAAPFSGWRDVTVGKSRTVAYAVALLAYLTAVTIACSSEHAGRVYYPILSAGFVLAMLFSAFHAALAFSDPHWLAELAGVARRAQDTSRRRLLPVCIRRYGAALRQPFLVLVLVAPIYALAAGLHEEGTGQRLNDLITVAGLWFGTGVCILLGAAGGACVGAEGRRGALGRAVAITLLTIFLYFLVSCFVGVMLMMDSLGKVFASTRVLLTTHLLLCILFPLPLGYLMLDSLRSGIRRGAEIPVEPESLQAAFRSVLGWRFWADPMVRAERRHLWTGKRIAIMWIAGSLLAGAPWIVFAAVGNVISPSPALSTFNVLRALFRYAAAPLLMATTLATDRNSGLLDSMRVTAAAPLRLACAKFWGRCSHLLFALMLPLSVSYLIARIVFFTDLSVLQWIALLGATVCWLVVQAAGILAWAGVGLHFAARQRTLAGAFGSVLALLIAGCLISTLVPVVGMHTLHLDPDRMLRSACGKLAWTLEWLVIYGLILRWAMLGAARHLAVPKPERG